MTDTDNLNPTGPLPRGWHRVTWTQSGSTGGLGPMTIYTDNIVAVVRLSVSLQQDSTVVPGSVIKDAWSDYLDDDDDDDYPEH